MKSAWEKAIVPILVTLIAGIALQEYRLMRMNASHIAEKAALTGRLRKYASALEELEKREHELWLRKDSIWHVQAVDSINNRFSARGMYRSGARLKALQDLEETRSIRRQQKQLEYDRNMEKLKLDEGL